VKQDGERNSVSSQNDNLGDATVEGLGSFVGAFFELTVVRCLLDKVENVLGERCVGDGPCYVESV
jgi:hypothetical protein